MHAVTSTCKVHAVTSCELFIFRAGIGTQTKFVSFSVSPDFSIAWPCISFPFPFLFPYSMYLLPLSYLFLGPAQCTSHFGSTHLILAVHMTIISISQSSQIHSHLTFTVTSNSPTPPFCSAQYCASCFLAKSRVISFACLLLSKRDVLSKRGCDSNTYINNIRQYAL